MARTAKITNANVAPSFNKGGLVGNTPVRVQDFNDLVGDYVSQTAASRMGVVATKTVTADATLLSSDSGKIILMGPTGVDITLPSCEEGLNFEIILTSDNSTTACTIVQAAASEDFFGHVFTSEHEAAATDGDTGVAANTKITFATSAMKGDRVSLVSDGTSWFVKAFCTNVADITLDN
tara:strand:- start:2085 stop:2621 length:537 start_codon:yes stop_codon:yes gene_type:complete